jgi:hypothetical protein
MRTTEEVRKSAAFCGSACAREYMPDGCGCLVSMPAKQCCPCCLLSCGAAAVHVFLCQHSPRADRACVSIAVGEHIGGVVSISSGVAVSKVAAQL